LTPFGENSFNYSNTKAERASALVVMVNPRGDFRGGLSWDNPLGDYISANRIKMQGLGRP